MSLVADYSDSDEGSDDNNNSDLGDAAANSCNDGNVVKARNPEEEVGSNDYEGSSTQHLRGVTVHSVTGKNSSLLLGADSESSESDSEDDSTRTSFKKKLNGVKLDNPFRTIGGTTNVSKEDSVFRNPFRDKEEEKIAVLEHHVKMTENPETALTINGKKICWNYRKRKCYLGTKCPYAHDSDVPLTEEQLKEQKAEGDLHRLAAGQTVAGGSKPLFNVSSTKTHLPGTASVIAGGYDSSAFFSSPHLSGGNKNTNSDVDDFVEQPHSKSKKRVGLTNSLIPPKKALNVYQKTKGT